MNIVLLVGNPMMQNSILCFKILGVVCILFIFSYLVVFLLDAVFRKQCHLLGFPTKSKQIWSSL